MERETGKWMNQWGVGHMEKVLLLFQRLAITARQDFLCSRYEISFASTLHVVLRPRRHNSHAPYIQTDDESILGLALNGLTGPFLPKRRLCPLHNNPRPLITVRVRPRNVPSNRVGERGIMHQPNTPKRRQGPPARQRRRTHSQLRPTHCPRNHHVFCGTKGHARTRRVEREL